MVMNTKAMGSLSSGLLARKGQARPAMRSQGFGGFGMAPTGVEDLGWNDMGTAPAVAAPVAEPSGAPKAVASLSRVTAPTVVPQADAEVAALPVPPVLVERDALIAAIEAPAVERSVSVATATRLRRETQHQAKAAFTLRVDADRHLKLRLAAALTNRSAQDLVTQSLDALIDSIPELATLVAELSKAAPGRQR